MHSNTLFHQKSIFRVLGSQSESSNSQKSGVRSDNERQNGPCSSTHTPLSVTPAWIAPCKDATDLITVEHHQERSSGLAGLSRLLADQAEADLTHDDTKAMCSRTKAFINRPVFQFSGLQNVFTRHDHREVTVNTFSPQAHRVICANLNFPIDYPQSSAVGCVTYCLNIGGYAL